MAMTRRELDDLWRRDYYEGYQNPCKPFRGYFKGAWDLGVRHAGGCSIDLTPKVSMTPKIDLSRLPCGCNQICVCSKKLW